MNDVASLTMPANLPERLTLANVLLTAMFAGLTFFILRANRAAVGAMREQMAGQNRPFVSVTVQVRMGTPCHPIAPQECRSLACTESPTTP